MRVEWTTYGAVVSWRDERGEHEVIVIPLDAEIRRYWCCDCRSEGCDHVQAAVHSLIDRESDR